MIDGEKGLLFLRIFPNNVTYQNIKGHWLKTQHLLDSIGWTDIYYDRESITYWVAANGKIIHYTKDFQIIRTYSDDLSLMREILTIIPDGKGNLWFNNTKKAIGNLN